VIGFPKRLLLSHMRDQTKLKAFELAVGVALVYQVTE
jgi:hypothetical protein